MTAFVIGAREKQAHPDAEDLADVQIFPTTAAIMSLIESPNLSDREPGIMMQIRFMNISISLVGRGNIPRIA